MHAGGVEILRRRLCGRLRQIECWQELESAAADYKANRSLNFYVDPSRGHDDYLMSIALTVKAAGR
jgi:hypothetical protein